MIWLLVTEMAFIRKLLLIFGALAAIYIAQLFKIPPIPQIKDEWWGEGNPKLQDETIKPFKIEIPNEV